MTRTSKYPLKWRPLMKRFASLTCLVLVAAAQVKGAEIQRLGFISNDSEIASMKINGTTWSDFGYLPIPSSDFPTSLAVDNVHQQLYWGQHIEWPIALTRSDFWGAGREELVLDPGQNAWMTSLAVDPLGVHSGGVGKLYIGELYLNTLKRSDLDGTNIQTLQPDNTARPVSIAIDAAGDRLFWGDFDSDTERTDLVQSRLDGTNRSVLVPFGRQSSISALAYNASDDMLYWTSQNQDGTGAVRRMQSAGGPIQTLVNFSVRPTRGIALDPNAGLLYWSDDRGIFAAGLDGSNVTMLGNFRAAQLVLMVPEPSTLVLLGLASSIVFVCRRRKLWKSN